jgi:hypothetical protein
VVSALSLRARFISSKPRWVSLSWDYLGEEPDARVRRPCSTRGSRCSRACGVANLSVTRGNTTGSQAIPPSRTGGLSTSPRRCSGHAFRSGSRAHLAEKVPFRRALGRGIPNEGRGRTHRANDAGRRAGNGTLRRKPPSGEQPFRVELVVAGERRAKTRRLAPPSWRPTWRPALPGGWRASTPGVSGGRRASPGRPKRCAVECGKDRRRHETRTGISGHCCRDRLRVGRRRSRQRRCRFASEWAPRG